MPRMLDKYTQEEETALTEINQKYSEPLKAAYARLDAALEAWTKRDDNQSREYYQALEDEMEAASAAANKINEAMLSETAAIQDDAEKRLFLSYGGDMAAMEEMNKGKRPPHSSHRPRLCRAATVTRRARPNGSPRQRKQKGYYRRDPAQ